MHDNRMGVMMMRQESKQRRASDDVRVEATLDTNISQSTPETTWGKRASSVLAFSLAAATLIQAIPVVADWVSRFLR
jgi:hypothetical protein